MHPNDTQQGDPEAAGRTRLSYMICFVPRSGSTLLAELLGSTGLAGAPEEYFHPVTMPRLMREWEVDTLEDYVRALLARKTGANGVFGVKVARGQYWATFGESDPRPLFPELRFVYVRRLDRVRQAVSWARALQTLQWASWVGARPDRRATYDPEEIERKLNRVSGDEAAWESLFAEHGISPLRVLYEELAEAREQTVRRVTDFIGAPLPAGFRLEQPRLERQADEESERWVARYLSELAQR
jgi:LPS sulfotransferase NodH